MYKMNILPRSAHTEIRTALKTFRVVSIVGPRQAGKTTLAREFGQGRPKRTFLTLDDLSILICEAF